jgi:hypothetical protein
MLRAAREECSWNVWYRLRTGLKMGKPGKPTGVEMKVDYILV